MASGCQSLFERDKLQFLKLRAKRTGIWFRVLSSLDRALIDSAIKVVDRVRSLRLARALFAVAKKMEKALESGVSRVTRIVGFPLAYKLGLLAKKWGNLMAESWISDVSFARFLAIMYINSRKNPLTGGL